LILNEQLYDLIPYTHINNSMIDEWVYRNTPENLPFVRKVFTALIKAFYKSEEVSSKFSEIDSKFDPDRDIFLPRLLSSKLSFLYDRDDFTWIMYGRLIKNIDFFKNLLRDLADSELEIRYTRDLLRQVVTRLDQGVEGLSDEGYKTDMKEGSFQVLVGRFVYIPDNDKALLGWDAYPFQTEVYRAQTPLKEILSAVLPARLMFVHLLVPCLSYSLTAHNNLLVEDSPFFDPVQLAQIQAWDDMQASLKYSRVLTNDVSASAFFLSNGTVKLIRIDQRTPITEITIPYSSEGESGGFSPFKFKINWTNLIQPEDCPIYTIYLRLNLTSYELVRVLTLDDPNNLYMDNIQQLDMEDL